MLFQVFAVEPGVADGQEPLRRETQAGRSTSDPRLRAFEFQIYADRSLIDGDEAGFSVGLEYSAVLLITEAGMVPQSFKYQREGIGIGNVELDFLATFVNFAAGASFICDHRTLARFGRRSSAQAQDLIGLPQGPGAQVEKLVRFERARRRKAVAVALDQSSRFFRGALPRQLDFSFGHLCSDDTMRQRAPVAQLDRATDFESESGHRTELARVCFQQFNWR